MRKLRIRHVKKVTQIHKTSECQRQVSNSGLSKPVVLTTVLHWSELCVSSCFVLFCFLYKCQGIRNFCFANALDCQGFSLFLYSSCVSFMLSDSYQFNVGHYPLKAILKFVFCGVVSFHHFRIFLFWRNFGDRRVSLKHTHITIIFYLLYV